MNIFNTEKLNTALDDAEEQEDMDGSIVKCVFLGKVFDLVPSGKYYMPYARSNVTEEEAEKDAEWYELADTELNNINAYLECDHGDPTDLFAVRFVREADSEED